MNDCGDFRNRLDDWLDDALSSTERTAFGRHLADCAACRAWFGRHERINAGLSELGKTADAYADGTGRLRTTGAAESRRMAVRVAAVIVLMVGTGTLLRSVVRRAFDAREPAPAVIVRETVEPGGSQDQAAPTTVMVTFNDDRDRLVVPVEAQDPRIHVVWLYDTIRPADDEASSRPAGTDKT